MGRPDSTIRICSGVRLNSKYEHSIYFPTIEAQRNYFAGKVVRTFSAVSYARRFWDLKVNATIEEANDWNYLYIINGQNPDEWNYFFINNIEYNNESSVILKLEMDVIQTYLKRFTLLPSFIERQHVEDDSIGLHTVEEGLNVGEYVNNLRTDVDDLKGLSVMALCTVDISSEPVANEEGENVFKTTCYATVRNKIFNGMGVFAADLNDYNQISETLQILDNAHPDAMVAMWMFPTAMIQTEEAQATRRGFKRVTNANPAIRYTHKRPTTLGGYTPRNNKLYCYPFNFIYVTNNAGGVATFRWEYSDSSSSSLSFRIRGAYTPDGGAQLVPENYKGIEQNHDESLTISGYPSCAWSSDEYKIWLAQNRNQQAHAIQSANMSAGLGVAGGLASLIGGIATANPLMMAGGVGAMVHAGVSGYQQVEGIMAQREDRSIQPPQSRGSFSSNINIVDDAHTFSFYDRCVNAEIAAQIDDYFSMYGYKLNRVQTPNIHARELYTYVKTVGCKIRANINNADALAIEAAFDKGITFWTNGDQIGEYLSNGIMKQNACL